MKKDLSKILKLNREYKKRMSQPVPKGHFRTESMFGEPEFILGSKNKIFLNSTYRRVHEKLRSRREYNQKYGHLTPEQQYEELQKKNILA